MRAPPFPKTRPALPLEYQAIFNKQYLENRNGETRAASASQRVEAVMHRWLAADAAPDKTTLELGAGTLNQLRYEKAGKAYDIVEPKRFLYERARRRYRVRDTFQDIRDIPEDRRYDRITSCAVLEHVCDLPDVLYFAATLLKEGGVFRAAIPSEGGWLWSLGWRCTTGLEFRLRHGLDYGVIMRHEHVNTAREIERAVRNVFPNVRVTSFGFGRNLSLYRFIEARLAH